MEEDSRLDQDQATTVVPQWSKKVRKYLRQSWKTLYCETKAKEGLTTGYQEYEVTLQKKSSTNIDQLSESRPSQCSTAKKPSVSDVFLSEKLPFKLSGHTSVHRDIQRTLQPNSASSRIKTLTKPFDVYYPCLTATFSDFFSQIEMTWYKINIYLKLIVNHKYGINILQSSYFDSGFILYIFFALIRCLFCLLLLLHLKTRRQIYS